jgi:hypothetical protein
VPLQVLFAGGLILLAHRARARRAGAGEWFPLAGALLYLLLASQSNLQLGVRLILPAIPLLLVLAGRAVQNGLETRSGRVALTLLLVWLAGVSAHAYPQGLAYFNEWAGGPKNGVKYLVDSNLDWGQNLRELSDYIGRNRIRKLTLYYFGFDKLHRYGLQDRVERRAPPWSPKLVRETRLIPEPGIYAVSASLLPGHFFAPVYRDYFRYFREREPDARAGHTIFIYKVPPPL